MSDGKVVFALIIVVLMIILYICGGLTPIISIISIGGLGLVFAGGIKSMPKHSPPEYSGGGRVFDLNRGDISFKKRGKVEYPFYSNQITEEEVIQRAKKMRSVLGSIFTISNNPYKLITVVEKAQAVGDKLDGEFVRIMSSWNDTADYDNLATFYTEKQLLQCSTGAYRSLADNFALYGDYIREKLEEKTPNPTNDQFRDFIFENIKSCHNFRCTLAAKIYDYFGAKSVLDFSAGWGDRLFAACAMDVKYVGIDPNKALRPSYNEIISKIGNRENQRVITSGAEYLSNESMEGVMSELELDGFDLLFTSPPYFDYEIYSTGPQSVNAYTSTYEKWLAYFLLFTLAKYARRIKDGGNVVIYMQDVGGKVYLEPIILFVAAFRSYMGLEYRGIFTSNKFPSIVFNKRSGESREQESRDLLKTHYPKIHKHASRIWELGVDNFRFDVSANCVWNGGKVYISDTGKNSSAVRSIFKLMLEGEFDTLIGYGSNSAGERVSHLSKLAEVFGAQFKYCVNRNELEWTGNTTQKKVARSKWIQAVDVEEFAAHEPWVSNDAFLEGMIARKWRGDAGLWVLPPRLFAPGEIGYLADSIKEMLLRVDDNSAFGGSYSGVVFIAVDTTEYLEALYIVFPLAKFCVLANSQLPANVVQRCRTEIVVGDNSENKLREVYEKKGDKGDLCFMHD